MTTEPKPVPTPTPADAPTPRPTVGGGEPAVPGVPPVPAQPVPPAQAQPTQAQPTQAQPTQAQPTQAQPTQAGPPAAAAPAHTPGPQVKRTRTGALWVSVAFFAVVLLLLLIFILQNGAKVSVNYMGAHGHLPLGVALLLSAVCGVLLVVLAGAARISQLRAHARRHRRAEARRVKAAAKAASQ